STPLRCAASRASAICAPQSSSCSVAGAPPRRSRARSVSPSSSSSTRYGRPSCAAIASASRWNRSRAASSAISGKNLSATKRFRRASRARNTSPMPPAPSRSSTTNGPTCRPLSILCLAMEFYAKRGGRAAASAGRSAEVSRRSYSRDRQPIGSRASRWAARNFGYDTGVRNVGCMIKFAGFGLLVSLAAAAGGLRAQAPPTVTPPSAGAPAPAPAQTQAEAQAGTAPPGERAHYPSLDIQGFADIDFSAPDHAAARVGTATGFTPPGASSDFNLGQFVLHFAGALSSKVS